MKRLFVLGLAVMAFGATVFANGNGVIYKLNNENTLKRVAHYLNADYQQKDDLQYVFGESVKRYEKAISKGESVDQASQKALRFNLANARAILSPDQYKKFIQVLNISVINEASTTLLAEK